MTRSQRPQRALSRTDSRFPTRTRQGLTPPEVAALYAAQHGRCAVCEEPLPGRRFVVDHDHSLSQLHGHRPEVGCAWCVRGLVDYKCNRGIALLNDDPAVLRRAAAYVGRRREHAA